MKFPFVFVTARLISGKVPRQHKAETSWFLFAETLPERCRHASQQAICFKYGLLRIFLSFRVFLVCCRCLKGQCRRVDTKSYYTSVLGFKEVVAHEKLASLLANFKWYWVLKETLMKRVMVTCHTVFGTESWFHIIFNIRIHSGSPCQGDSGDEAREPEFCQAGEQLEHDEELRLHIYGWNSAYSKFDAEF